MEELHRLTLRWAEDRQLLTNGKIPTQALKLGSEFGELNFNLANNNPIKDDVGDCLVVCTILSHLQGYNFLDDCMATEPTRYRTPGVPTAMWHLGLLQDKVIKGQNYIMEMRNFINQLEGIAATRHTNLEECWAIAYEDIKDRKGYLNEFWNFIKEEK